MNKIKVKDFMVPTDDYATVNENELLYDAILALEKAQEDYLQRKEDTIYPHRALLVLDSSKRVVGKLSQHDILKAMEPKYQDIISNDDSTRTAVSGFSPDFLESMMSQYQLFDQPLVVLCRNAANIRVKDCMYTISEGAAVDENDSLGLAIHQLIIGEHQSLLVTRGDSIIGILRLTDVFHEVCNKIKEFKI